MPKGKAIVGSLGKLGELLGGTTAERMARAESMGFDTSRPVYHGTDTDFAAFDPERSIGTQFWSTTDKSAIEAGDVGAAGKGVIKEMYHRIKNPAGWKEYDKYGIDELISQGYDGLALPDSDGHTTYTAFYPNQYRDVRADFNPDSRESSDLLASVAPLAVGGALTAAALSPEDAAAAAMAYANDEAEAHQAATHFAQLRSGKAGYWEQRRQDLLDMVDGLTNFAETTAFPALDKPLQGYLGLTGAAGALANGQSFEQAIMHGAQQAQQPVDQTTYQLGQSVNDALRPYVPDEAAAAAGALTHGGLQVLSPI